MSSGLTTQTLRHGAKEPFYGVKVGDLKPIQKRIKKDHALALALYDTGVSDAMYLAALIAEADERQFDDPRFRRELASWIHSSRSSDGMLALSQGLPALSDFTTKIAALTIRTFDVGNGVAAAHEQLARG